MFQKIFLNNHKLKKRVQLEQIFAPSTMHSALNIIVSHMFNLVFKRVFFINFNIALTDKIYLLLFIA